MSAAAEAACQSCANLKTFQLPSLCAEVGQYQCSNFLGGGAWAALTECSSCCTALLDPAQRGEFWEENCGGSRFFLSNGDFSNADADLKLPAQWHSSSLDYPWSKVEGGHDMKEYVFKKSYIDAPLMPFHTLREQSPELFPSQLVNKVRGPRRRSGGDACTPSR